MAIEIEGNPDIVLKSKGRVIIRITKKGFYYRNVKVDDPNDVLNRFSEWLGIAEKELPEEAEKDRQGTIVEPYVMPIAIPESIGGAGPCMPKAVGPKEDYLIIQVSGTGDDKGEWVDMLADDLPEWAKTPKAISDMREGTKIQSTTGAAWFRAVRCVLEKEEKHVN